MNLYDKVFPPKVIVLPNGKNVTKPRSRAHWPPLCFWRSRCSLLR